MVTTKQSVIARSEATRQSPAIGLAQGGKLEIASLRNDGDALFLHRMSHPPIPSRHIVTTPRRTHDMSKVTDPFAASPQLMTQWMAVSLAAQDRHEPSLVQAVKVRSSHPPGRANF